MTELLFNPLVSTRTLVSYGGKIVLLKRNSKGELANTLELPGGTHDDPTESLYEAALREVQQESQLQVEVITPKPVLVDSYRINGGKHIGRDYLAFGLVAIAHNPQEIVVCDENPEAQLVEPTDIANGNIVLTRASRAAFQVLSPYLREHGL